MNDVVLLVVIAVGVVLVLAAAVAVRRRPGPEPETPKREKREPGEVEAAAKPEETAPVQTPAPVEQKQSEAVVSPPQEVEAPVEAPPVPETVVEVERPPVEPAGPRVSRLSAGLAKTKQALGRTLSGIAKRDRLSDEDWDDVEAALISADVGVKATSSIINALRDAKPTAATLPEALKAELILILNRSDRELRLAETRPSVWLVTGVNGVGKTTSIAKLAKRLTVDGHKVVLAAADTFRAAAIEQLETWAGRIGVHMVRHAEGSDPGAVVFDAIEHARAKGADVVIVDTAGRLHTKSNLMEELKKVRRIADREGGSLTETLLVLDATVGQNGIAQARSFQEAVDVTGVILAKLDGSAKGGIVLAIQDELGIPVKAVGLGEQIDDLEPFDPEEFAAALVEGL